ncbi:MAG: lipopolysaccharide transport periplasmic protein LptA [Paracoccus sp. (in: a-proteobacteria)]|nr:lipopolysaccharide transport periplasmic protein LptA [Paracoccus sp. (in: a-proteobacteria)]
MRRDCLALLLALLAAPVSALAQTVPFGGVAAQADAPIEVSADEMVINQATGQTDLTGKVVIAQGEMRLSADRVSVVYESGTQRRISGLDATGNVVLVQGADAAEAEHAVYDVASQLVTLTGNVLVTQGQNVMSGERIVVNLADGTAQATGRVRTILQPGTGQ